MAAPPPKTFADLAEAKEAMGKLIKTLNDNRTELEELIKAADGDQQKKMSTVIPKLQSIIAGPMQEAGFPPPPMGMMQGMMAFTQASQLEGGAIITEGMGVLQKGMMGSFPSEDELDALLAKLK